MDFEDFKKQMAETQKVMNQNLAESVYDEGYLLRYLNAHGRKPVKWTYKHEFRKWRSRLGRMFLAIANWLGEYNDYD